MSDRESVEQSELLEKSAILEAILFVSKEPVEPERIMDFFGHKTIDEFEKLVTALNDFYIRNQRGIMLKRSAGGFQLTTKPDMYDVLKEFFARKVYTKLTIPSLETLSIVAYRQPVTIAEVSELRGVNSIGPIKSLLQKKLIKITGRKKVPGLPALYSTSKEFLLYFGLNDLSELPSLEELTEMFEEKEQPTLFNV